MVDREARARLQTALTQLMDGSITVSHFVQASDELLESPDLGVVEITSFGRMFEDDLWPWRRLKNLDAKTRDYAERCSRFLKTDVEYRWPSYPPASPSWWLTLAVFLACGYGLMAIALGITLCILALSLLNVPFIATTIAIVASGAAVLWFSSRLQRRDLERIEREFWRHGDRDAWPFLTRTEYQAADTIPA